MHLLKRRLALFPATILLAFAAASWAQPAAPARPAIRAPDVRYEPTPQNVVIDMLKLAKVGTQDLVYDLGCGDARIVITAVREFHARGVCIDIDPRRIREGRANAELAGVTQRIRFAEQDLFETELSDATVVTLF